MNTTRTLALAAFAAMSLGIGAAMAQEGTSAPDPNYGPNQQFYAPIAPMTSRGTSAVQAGSSDVDTTRAVTPGTTYDNGDLANPG
jgi:hypothetical protein